jgi:hypothetical protein
MLIEALDQFVENGEDAEASDDDVTVPYLDEARRMLEELNAARSALADH